MFKRCLILFLVWFSVQSLFAQTTAIRASCEPIRTEESFGNHKDAWEFYLKENINTNIPVLNCAPAGKYYVEVLFLIGKKGQIEHVRPKTKLGYGMEEELMRVILLSPLWTPATQNGKVHRTYRCETFIFRVGHDGVVWL